MNEFLLIFLRSLIRNSAAPGSSMGVIGTYGLFYPPMLSHTYCPKSIPRHLSSEFLELNLNLRI